MTLPLISFLFETGQVWVVDVPLVLFIVDIPLVLFIVDVPLVLVTEIRTIDIIV
jgi:hypothetical protein